MIRGITFSEQAFYSADFAHYQNFFLNQNCGITKGCQVTQDGTAVTIGTGYFIACGRLLNVEEAEVITEVQGFESGYNRIVYEIDLSKENTIEEFRQGSIKVLHTEELLQEDLDAGGMVYQMPFCSFQWSGTEISDFLIDAPTLVLDNIFADVSANFDTVNRQFGEWFDQRKQGVLGMISDLEAQGFEKRSVYQVATLQADTWNSETKTYSFEETYPSETYNLNVEPIDCTQEQAEAWGAILPMGSSRSNMLTALGVVDKKEYTLPISLLTYQKEEPYPYQMAQL